MLKYIFKTTLLWRKLSLPPLSFSETLNVLFKFLLSTISQEITETFLKCKKVTFCQVYQFKTWLSNKPSYIDILISISELDSLSSSKCVLLSTWIFHKDDLVDLHDVVWMIFLTLLSVISPSLSMIFSGKSSFIM